MKKSDASPWKPPKWELADAHAIQAVIHGEATKEQQIRAMKYIVDTLCGTYEFHYFGNEGDTAFALGKAFVGQQIVALPAKLKIVNQTRRKENV